MSPSSQSQLLSLGIFLLLAARDPVRHLSLIWFTVWSSVAHGTVMAVWGDVAGLYITAIVLATLARRVGAEAR